jgi:urate oxidase
MPKLIGHHYGKAKVRVLKILRDGPVHRIKEIDVTVLLRGDFETSYTSGDNSKVVATDTIKNTIQVLAKQHLGDELERFAISICEHFLERHPQVREVKVDIAEREWRRMKIKEQPHPHSFVNGGEARLFTRITCGRDNCEIQSGVRDLLILKSTGSGFEGYAKDEFTILPPTSDRILATSFTAAWTFKKLPVDCRDTNAGVLNAMLAVFAENYSPSAQTTLFQMGQAALATSPEISTIDLAMPNKHCLLVDLARFGLENKNEVFVPTDEPHGQIEATIARDD